MHCRDQELPANVQSSSSSSSSNFIPDVSKAHAPVAINISTKGFTTATPDDVINVTADASSAGTNTAATADAHVLDVPDLQEERDGSSCKLQRSGSSIYDLHSKRRRYLYLIISALASTLVSWQ
jgi:phage-related tail fiber protein